MRCRAARLRSAARCLTGMSTFCGAPSRQPCAPSAAAACCGPACSPADLPGRVPVAFAENVNQKHASTAARTQADDQLGGRSGSAPREASPGVAKRKRPPQRTVAQACRLFSYQDNVYKSPVELGSHMWRTKQPCLRAICRRLPGSKTSFEGSVVSSPLCTPHTRCIGALMSYTGGGCCGLANAVVYAAKKWTRCVFHQRAAHALHRCSWSAAGAAAAAAAAARRGPRGRASARGRASRGCCRPA